MLFIPCKIRCVFGNKYGTETLSLSVHGSLSQHSHRRTIWPLPANCMIALNALVQHLEKPYYSSTNKRVVKVFGVFHHPQHNFVVAFACMKTFTHKKNLRRDSSNNYYYTILYYFDKHVLFWHVLEANYFNFHNHVLEVE